MTIRCEVSVNSSLSATASTTVYINIIDVNDNSPTFVGLSSSSQEYVASIAEDAEVGTVVAVVTATDNDSGTSCP